MLEGGAIWSIVDFGKHAGKSLPQIVLTDPDWLYWAIGKGVFDKHPLKGEALMAATRAQAIRIPGSEHRDLAAEYVLHPPTGRFVDLKIVPASLPSHVGESPTFRKPVIDLSVPHQIAPYDKLGGKI